MWMSFEGWSQEAAASDDKDFSNMESGYVTCDI